MIDLSETGEHNLKNFIKVYRFKYLRNKLI